MSASSHEKSMVAMKHWILGMAEHDPNWFVTFRAMEFALKRHDGMRKDGKTPAFEHQLSIARMLRTLRRSMSRPWLVMACAFLHDVREDCGTSLAELRERFGDEVARIVELLTKKTSESKKDFATYVREMGEDEVASLVKIADRIHNLSTMMGVFGVQKQLAYLNETQEFYEPMIKAARDLFPEQEAASENLLLALRAQMSAIRAVLGDGQNARDSV